jgi:hypothetical protein
VADYRSGGYLPTVGDVYAQRFHAFNGIRPLLTAPDITLPVLHRQSSGDIEHATYRQMCYARPGVSERLALLVPQPSSVWLSVNLYIYSGDQSSCFQPGEIARIQAVASLVQLFALVMGNT